MIITLNEDILRINNTYENRNSNTNLSTIFADLRENIHSAFSTLNEALFILFVHNCYVIVILEMAEKVRFVMQIFIYT